MPPFSHLHALAAFLPSALVRGLAEDENRPREGGGNETLAVVLFADLSGFSPLAEALDRSGPEGSERLTRVLDTCFSALIEKVLDHGGDILRFAGDAILALWPAESEGDLSRVARLAAQCALAAQAGVADLETGEEATLRLRVGIGAGWVQLLDVGGESGRWEFLAVGPPLLEMARAEHAANPGEVVFSERAWQLLAGAAAGVPLPCGEWRLTRLEPHPLPRVRLPEPTSRMERALRAYLPPVVLGRFDAGHNQWLSELRNVTVLFINLRDPGLAAGERPQALQAAFRSIQAALQRYEGSANQLVVDDKGVVTVAAFGLPPVSHEDDAARAALAALELHEALTLQGLAVTLGIASGRVLCCAYGTEIRREYVMVGHTVNVAARLMQTARTVLCDGATARLAPGRLCFEELGAIPLNGCTEPLEVFCPKVARSGLRAPREDTLLVGREKERACLNERMRALSARGEGGLVLIEGEAGLGKSSLLRHALALAGGLGLPTSLGLGDPLRKTSAYRAWQAPLLQVLGLDGLPDAAARTLRLLALLQDRPELRSWAPLLNAVLLIEVPESDVLQLEGPLRSANTRELLVRLLQDAAAARPQVVVLDDVHWMDCSSWELVQAVQARGLRLLLILAGRSPQEPLSPGLRLLREQPGTVQLRLEPMPSDELLVVARRRLGASALDPELADFIHQKADGNPFFAQELASALLEAGHLVRVADRCQLSPWADLPALDLPRTVLGVVSSRIDRLPPSQQLILKVASLIGHAFQVRLLQEVYPIPRDKAALAEHLEVLARAELLVREAAAPEPTYAFRHALIRDAAYELLVFSQRHQLHRALALCLERELGRGDDAALYPLLAHHWRRAEAPAQALDYLEKAGGAALARSTYREAVTFLSEARELAAQVGPLDDVRRARWCAWQSAAYFGLGELDLGIARADEGLEQLGWPVPQTPLRWGMLLAREVLRQLVHLLWPRRLSRAWGDGLKTRLELRRELYAMRAVPSHASRSPVSYFACTLATTNDGEMLGGHGTLSRAYTLVGAATHRIGLRWLAARYFRNARQTRNPSELSFADAIECFFQAWSNACWEVATALAERAQTVARQMNDISIQLYALEGLGQVQALSRAPGASLGTYAAELALARKSSQVLVQIWALLGTGRALLSLGLFSEVLERMGEVERLLPRTQDVASELSCQVQLAVASLRLGKTPRALAAVERALALMKRKWAPTSVDSFAYVALSECCVAFWETARREGGDPRCWVRRMASICRALRKQARAYPTAAAMADRVDGMRSWMSGWPACARRLWTRALARAHVFRLPYEEGLIHLELARHAPDASVRAGHLDKARTLFTGLGCVHELQWVNRLTAGG